MEKGQSKLRSFLEANVNTVVGFLITLLASPIIYKMVGIVYVYGQLLQVTILFTLLSVVRGYVIRRFFNKKEIKKDKELLEEIKYWEEQHTKALIGSVEWRKLYESTRKVLAQRTTELAELTDSKNNSPLFILLLEQLDKAKEELEMCKHLHTAAISDLVEGADYHSGDESSRNEGWSDRVEDAENT